MTATSSLPASRFARRPLMAAALALALPAAAGAQQATLRADVSARTLGLEDQVQFVISLEGQSVELREEIAMPDLQNLEVAAGPSTSTQISLVNGRMSQAKSYTYLLRPTALGQAVIGAVRAVLTDGTRTTEPITLEVVPGSVLPKRQPAPAWPFAGDQDPFDAFFGRRQPAADVKVYVEAHASRDRLFVGEALLLTYSLFTQTAVAGLDFAEAPRYPGFWSEQLPQEDPSNRGEVVVAGGEQFTRFTVFRKLLIPTKAGRLTIPATTFKISVPRRAGFFVDPFPGAATTVTRSTAPIEIVVDPPSTGEPFSGAVGQFRATASLDRQAIDLGEAVTYRFKVEGRGNLKWIETGPGVAIPDAKVYPPQTSESFTATPEGLKGSKTWEFVVVPHTAGTVAFPALTFAYFDPAGRRVAHARTEPLALEVRSTVQVATAASAAPRAAATEVARLPLRSDLDRSHRSVPPLGAGGLVAALLAVGVGHAAVWGLPLLLTRGKGERAERAHRSVRRALGDVRRAARGGMTKEAAAVLIEEALTEVFGAIDERPSADEDERTANLRQLLRDIRFVRFAPQLGDYSERIREIADRATSAIRRWA